MKKLETYPTESHEICSASLYSVRIAFANKHSLALTFACQNCMGRTNSLDISHNSVVEGKEQMARQDGNYNQNPLCSKIISEFMSS